ncbi:MAG: M15 family metallopeptidase [Gammaproteobacteria bacterium]|nr:M15 family metallopeptidase [Gammaproteobacteria bacterium]
MIKGSVGKGGLNKEKDVTAVQKLLNNYLVSQYIMVLALLKEDGRCGRITIVCIEDFQSMVVGLSRADGRIDVGGKTMETLKHYETLMKQKLFHLASGIVVGPTSSSKSQIAVKKNQTHFAASDPRKLKTRAAIANAYGAISKDKKWAKKGEFLKKYTVSDSIKNDPNYNWINSYDPKKRKVSIIWCHKTMHTFLDISLKNLKDRNLLRDLKEFGGSHAIRTTRGTTNWSALSWALAIDINMTGNGLGKTPAMSEEFAECFTDAGFGWGGKYSRKDGMHFTIAGFDMPAKK